MGPASFQSHLLKYPLEYLAGLLGSFSYEPDPGCFPGGSYVAPHDRVHKCGLHFHEERLLPDEMCIRDRAGTGSKEGGRKEMHEDNNPIGAWILYAFASFLLWIVLIFLKLLGVVRISWIGVVLGLFLSLIHI